MTLKVRLSYTVPMERSKAIKYYKLAQTQASLFSKDTTKVGAIVLARNSYHILATGYNGFIRDMVETTEMWAVPNKYIWVIHAEANAVANAARAGACLHDAIAIMTLFPCHECTKLLIQAGITMFISVAPNLHSEKWGQSFSISQQLIGAAGITLLTLTAEELAA